MKFKIFFLASLMFSSYSLASTFVQESSSLLKKEGRRAKVYSNNHVPINIGDILTRGIIKNYKSKIWLDELSLIDLEYNSNWDQYWLPHVSLKLQTIDGDFGALYSGSTKDSGGGKRSYSFNHHQLALEIDDYTIFNWGLDQIDFRNTKDSLLNEKLGINKEQLEFRHLLTTTYFDFLKRMQIEKIAKEQLQSASFIYRLNRERITLKKVGKQEYLQSRSEYLRAQSTYQLAKKELLTIESSLASLLQDKQQTRYFTKERIKFKKLEVSFEQAIDLMKITNFDLLMAANDIAIANRNYEKGLKESLPLPKISISLGAYSHQFGNNENSSHYQNELGGSNVDLVASINATWDIMGSDGFLNGRKRAKSRIKREIAHKKYLAYTEDHSHHIKSLISEIRNDETQIKILKAYVANVQRQYDFILGRYVNRKTIYLNFHNSLKELTETKVKLEETLFNHLKKRILLTYTLGLDQLPSEKIQDLVEEEKMR
jgi:outer membrane protein TolC